MQFLAFPMRLQQNGLLRRDSQIGSLISLLQVMARTPAGSWSACPEFGLLDLFEGSRQRADVARIAMGRINRVLEGLGLNAFYVSDIVREISPNRDTDTYSVTVTRTDRDETFTTILSHE
jgi:hypothetical protein